MQCPQTDRKINSSRVYHRIVLPVAKFNESNPCNFPKGAEVVVLLTSFAGTDPHALLLAAAAQRNMSVYFGLPVAPRSLGESASAKPGLFSALDSSLLEAYYAWVFRLLRDHEVRYGHLSTAVSHPREPGLYHSPSPRTPTPGAHRGMMMGKTKRLKSSRQRSLYNSTLAGYYSREESFLPQISQDAPLLAVYTRLGELVHAHQGKRLAVSPSVNVNRGQLNATVLQHVQGFEAIAGTGHVDIIAVMEGRGWGRGCYYWPGQEGLAVSQVDNTLDRVLHYLQPGLKANVTFLEACTASNQQIFVALERSQEALRRKPAAAAVESPADGQGATVELWLGVEALEYLRDDPCLPVDPADSGNGQLLNRASKGRVDRALTVASVRVQKVASFAWDADFTCTTRRYNFSLAAQIRSTASQPLIANCSFHSPANKSIVVIGYNMEGLTQSFEVNWPARGQRRVSHLYGYYFELDWGARHNRVPSLEYTQLYDLPNVLTDLDLKGWVKVKAGGTSSVCIFQYDFSRPLTLGRNASSYRRYRL